MLEGYHKMFNLRLFQTLDTSVDMPDAQLGIGYAEDLTPKPLVLHYQNQLNQKAMLQHVQSVTDASPKLQGESVPLSDFLNTGWLGNPYGAV